MASEPLWFTLGRECLGVKGLLWPALFTVGWIYVRGEPRGVVSWLAPIMLDLRVSKRDPKVGMVSRLGWYVDDIELRVLSMNLFMHFLFFFVFLCLSLLAHLLPKFLSELLDRTLGCVGLIKRSLKVSDLLLDLEPELSVDVL